MSFHLDKKDLINPQTALKYEWLETNALGGFAYNTALNCATRKYHSLLNAPLFDGTRFNLLSKIEAVLIAGKKMFHLSTNKYIDVYHPTGHKYLTDFEFALCPSFTYRIGDIVFKKSIMMPRHENSVILKYELVEAEKGVTLQLSPLMAYRNMHELTVENMYFKVKTEPYKKNTWKMNPYDGMPDFFFNLSHKTEFFPGPDWYKGFDYLKEKSRGYDHLEDLFCPGMFEYKLKPQKTLYLRAGLINSNVSPEKSWNDETERRLAVRKEQDKFLKKQKVKLVKHFETDTFKQYLYKSADFLISSKRGGKPSVIAGFPWFGEWGRDTMIALPGLCLYTGKADFMIDVLKTYADYEKNGLFPNQLSLGENSAYNSVDSSLWFFRALRFYIESTGNEKMVKERFLKTMENIISAHLDGNVPWSAINVETGFLAVGSPETQLTWMDAKAYGHPVTPRFGMAVEINALWYEALTLFLKLAEKKHPLYPRVGETATKVKTFFADTFFCETDGGVTLADTITEDGKKFTNFRPNQMIALSTEEDLISKKSALQIIGRLKNELLTPAGMRTLSPRDPMYKGCYHGSQDERDGAYHQGTVWPWLFGPYADTLMKYLKPSDESIAELFTIVTEFIEEHANMYGVMGASEIFEGTSPHRAKGCPFQAWSVAETIRAWFKLYHYIQSADV